MSEEQQRGKRPARRAPARSGKWEWEPDPRLPYPPRPRAVRCRSDGGVDSAAVALEASVQPGWRLSDVLLAAKLLDDQPHVHFQDEAQMRRVFGLVYDVLRYEQVLERALDDVGFWARFRQLQRRDKVVRLLLYDLQGRKFARVGDNAAVAARKAALHQAGLLEIEDAIHQLKTRLAASLSRLRIGGSALSLDELLPAHLRTAEGVTWGQEGSLATGWVNGAKATSRQHFVEEMGKLGLRLCTECSAMDELDEDQFMFDPLCPKVVNLHERAREKLAASELVKSYAFVFLERSLCLGAAALVHAIRVGKMCGPVILTHPLAPRHTGYLAELLVDIDGIGRLLVFGLGGGLSKHKEYLEELGIPVSRCKLFAERYASAATTGELERTTIVLATPPTSCTGVRDVVDLAVARGGDLRLLETLTCPEAQMKQQPNYLLTEQMACLSHALSKPNCQLLVYEAHTLLPCETTDMVRQAVDNANRMALDKYLKEHPPRKKSPTLDGTGRKSKGKKSLRQLSKTHQNDESKSETETDDKTSLTDIPIPDSDLFEISDLNDLYRKDCSNLVDPGSFIAVIKRKDMMQFNSLFMIKVAEAKGVFGDPTKQPEQPKPVDPVSAPPLKTSPSGRKSVKRPKVQLERLRAPTFATIMRALHEHSPCPRHARHVSAEESQLESQVREARRRDARRWWADLASHYRARSAPNQYQFHALRTDPVTRKILFPAHLLLVKYAESVAST